MTQTLAEKLRVIADAIDAGEKHVALGGVMYTIDYVMDGVNLATSHSAITRIPAQITIGKRVINAPLRVMPKNEFSYWYVMPDGGVLGTIFESWSADDVRTFNAANCWATEADAKAYAEASLAVRRGEV